MNLNKFSLSIYLLIGLLVMCEKTCSIDSHKSMTRAVSYHDATRESTDKLARNPCQHTVKDNSKHLATKDHRRFASRLVSRDAKRLLGLTLLSRGWSVYFIELYPICFVWLFFRLNFWKTNFFHMIYLQTKYKLINKNSREILFVFFLSKPCQSGLFHGIFLFGFFYKLFFFFNVHFFLCLGWLII